MENLPALITLITYAIVLLGISIVSSRRAKSETSFLLGDRNLGPWVAGLAYAASSSSAWVLLGFSGFVYSVGPSALWMVPGILLGYAAVWFWAGPVLQASSRQKGHLTLTDFLAEHASPVSARLIRIAASLMIVFCFSYYVASQFQGAGVAFDSIFGTGLSSGILLGAAIILAYTFLGGFLAVSVIDMIQGLLIGIVAIVLPVLAFAHVGGMPGLADALAAAPDSYGRAFGTRAGWIAAGFVTGLFATGFGALGQPHLITWIMASRDRKSRIQGAGIAIGWGAIVYVGMAILGLCARATFGMSALSEGVFFQLAETVLPAAFSGIIVAATLSAIMSTVDSQLLVAGAAISHDLGLGKAMGNRPLLVSRLAIAVVSIAAVIMTLAMPSTIFERTLFAWTALGASFGPTVVARAAKYAPTGEAVLGSILTGFTCSVAFEFVLSSGPGAVWARTVPWVAAICVLAAVHLATKGNKA